MQRNDWTRLYRLLADLGLPQPSVPVTHDDGRDPIPIGWPELKFGIGFAYTDAKAWERDDWTVIVLGHALSKSLPDTLLWLDELLYTFLLRQSEVDASQTVSSHERLLLDELLRHGLPQPDRNFTLRRVDGSVLTVPDFTWEDVRLAVFVDGFYHHGGRDLDKAVKAAAGEDGAKRRRALQSRAATIAEKDARNRRAMVADGWTVLNVSDHEIDRGPDAVRHLAGEILGTYQSLRRDAQAG